MLFVQKWPTFQRLSPIYWLSDLRTWLLLRLLTNMTLMVGCAFSSCCQVYGVLHSHAVFCANSAKPADAADAVNAVAQGDLTINIPLQAGDSSSLMSALVSMRESLSRVVSDVRSNAEGVPPVPNCRKE